MAEPVAIDGLLTTFLSSAAVIVFGGLYAGLFASARLWRRRWMMPLALCGYGLTAVAVLTLAQAANLHGMWAWLVVAMLVGYLLAPYGIWYLCVATHGEAETEARSGQNNQSNTVDD
jgi:hypothetical protein